MMHYKDINNALYIKALLCWYLLWRNYSKWCYLFKFK